MNMMRAGAPEAGLSGSTTELLAEPSISPSVLPGLLRMIDMLGIFLAGAIAHLAVGASTGLSYTIPNAVFVAVFVMIVGDKAQIYAERRIMRPYQCLNDVAVCLFSATMFFLSIAFALRVEGGSILLTVVVFATSVVVLAVLRIAAHDVLLRLSDRNIIGKRIAIIGGEARVASLLEQMRAQKPHFVQLTGVYLLGPPPRTADDAVTALIDAVRARHVDEVIVATPFGAGAAIENHLARLRELPVSVLLSPDLGGFEAEVAPSPGVLAGTPVFELARKPLSGWAALIKALEDYVGAAVLLVVLSPLMLAIAALIRLDSPGPVFYMQSRLGFNNQPFRIYKFRSMHVTDCDTGVVAVRQARKGDPRVTRVGRFIRSTSLDELPQLLNVLNGTMSLVGPRPHAISHNEEYGRQIRGYFARHKVKPGITGWAQVNGLRGETDTIEKMEARIRHDVYYAENWSIFFDIRILISTVFTFLLQRTAY